MANTDNLMSPEELNSRRTPEQHSEDSRKGGIASGKSRRENRTRQDIARRFLAMKVKDPAAKEVAQRYGVSEEELEGLDYEELMFLQAVKTCVEEGRLKDLIDLYKLMGEYTETTKVENTPPSVPSGVTFIPAKKD